MKRIFSALVLAVMILSLAACGQAPQRSSQGQFSSSSELSQPSPGSEASSEPKVSEPKKETEPAADTSESGKTLVVYFSASGNTQAVAESMAAALGADIYELEPEQPYTDADLDWNDPDSRVNAEHGDPSFRAAIAGEAKDLSSYDTVLIGYPLWWKQAPSIVWNFVESSGLAGKTIVPFCTSMSDGIGSSGDTLAAMAPGATWLAGQRFGESLDEAAVTQWVNGLGLTATVIASVPAAQ